MTDDRTIVLRGPFTDADIRLFWQLLQQIEATRPTERFKLVIDNDNSTVSKGVEEAMAALDEIAPVAEGYARVKGFQRRQS